MAGISNTSRTLKHYRDKGWNCCISERWIINPKHPAGGYRKDLFGFGDIVAMGEGSIIAIQSCGQDFSAHDKKLLGDEVAPNMIEWLRCGGRVILIGWRKIKKKRGGKAKIWSPRIKEYSVSDFGVNEIEIPDPPVNEETLIERWDQV